MKAIVQDTYGSTDVLRLREIARPQPAEGEVLVRVQAAGVDRGAWHLMTGRPYLMRVLGFGLRAPKVAVRGRELAGRVEATGPGVTAFRPGDEVMGIAEGTFAEFATAREDRLVLKPANLSYEQAAALPVSGTTALQAVRDHAGVQPGQKVLVVGASGGVGSFAVQLAKAFGAEVTGVCGTSKLDLVRSLGADHVIDYRTGDFAAAGPVYDTIIDTGGRNPLARLRGALAPKGTLVLVGGEGGDRWLGGIGRQLRAPAVSAFSAQKVRMFITRENRPDLEVLAALAAAGKVRPAVGRTYALEAAAQAIRDLEAGQARGKLVISLAA